MESALILVAQKQTPPRDKLMMRLFRLAVETRLRRHQGPVETCGCKGLWTIIVCGQLFVCASCWLDTKHSSLFAGLLVISEEKTSSMFSSLQDGFLLGS